MISTPGVSTARSAIEGAGLSARDGARVEGFALAGGLEIALTCDLIVAAKGVKLGIPEVNKGLLAAGGGLFRLPTRIPYGVAMEMALTSDPITAVRFM